MTAGLLIDTDVLIDYLRGEKSAVDYLERVEEPLFVSSITVGELYSGVREGRERIVLADFMRGFQVIPVDAQIAVKGGLFCRDYRKAHGVGLADSLIAATAAIRGLSLVTLNQKHFPMLSKMGIPYRKT